MNYTGLSEYNKEPPPLHKHICGGGGKLDKINILFLQVLILAFEVEQIVKNPK